jgi:hypothetical protein
LRADVRSAVWRLPGDNQVILAPLYLDCVKRKKQNEDERISKRVLMMPGVSVNGKPAILDWTMRKDQLRSAGSSVIDVIAKWMSGEKTPAFNQIEGVSRKISIPFGYFFLEKPLPGLRSNLLPVITGKNRSWKGCDY